MGTLLRYPYEVRSEKEYFEDIQDVKITKDMLDLAKHIVEQKSGSFEPDAFEDHYESALIDLINKKRSGVALHLKGGAQIERQCHQSDGCVEAQPRHRAASRPCPKSRLFPQAKGKSRARLSPASARCCCRSAARVRPRKSQRRRRPRNREG